MEETMNNLLREEEEEEEEEAGLIRGVNNNVILPTILIFEILLLLPVRLLLRFRCVCKEWCELIDSRLFKDTFLARRRQRAMAVVDDHRLFILKDSRLRCWFGDYQSLVALASAAAAAAVIPSSSNFEIPVEWSALPMVNLSYQTLVALASAAGILPSSSVIPPSSSSSCSNSNGNFEIPVEWSAAPTVNIINHVDGIICLFDRGDYFLPCFCFKQGTSYNWLAITLVNPALRQFRKVPLPPQEFDLFGDIYKRRVQGIGIGFSNNNEYKVVAIVTVFEKEREDYGSPYKHIGMVYHLTTNSWKILGDLSEFGVSFKCFCHSESVFSHGSLHWCVTSSTKEDLVDNDETRKHQILAFDVTNESFRNISFPHRKITSHCLFTVDNKSTIALVEYISLKVFDRAIQIWVMNEYGNTDSWTKRWLITNLEDFAETLCFLDQDKILLDLGPVGLSSYDLSKGQLVDEIPTKSAAFIIRPLVSCHESFVSVKQL